MEQRPPSRNDLLTAYVRLRVDGHSVDEAIEKIKPFAFKLSSDDRIELGNEVNAWEEAQLEPLDVPQAKPNKPAPAPELPRMCPNCGRKNSPTAKECVSCYAPLTSAASGTRRIRKEEFEDDVRLDQKGRIYLSVRDRRLPVDLSVYKEIILGRSSPDTTIKPHIDLAPFDAEKLGVSRAHASLKMRDETLVITDLESSNFTHINDERIYPHETRVLRDGDIIRLGDLPIRVTFKV